MTGYFSLVSHGKVTRRSILAASACLLLGSSAVRSRLVIKVASITRLAGVRVPNGIGSIEVSGYFNPGDGGGGTLRRALQQRPGPGRRASRDGAWWEWDSDQALSTRHFGVRHDGRSEEAQAIAEALAWLSEERDRTLLWPAGIVHVGEPAVFVA